MTSSTSPSTIEAVVSGRRSRARRRLRATGLLAAIAILLFLVTLMVGNTFYGLDEVVRVVLGQTVPGASFTVGELRLPRSVLAVLTGFAFGAAGVTFQTMLRNPLASPDVIGISFGASAAAVVGIVFFSLSETAVSLVAFGSALATAAAILLLSHRGGFSGARLILIGIGIAAMMHSVITYSLSKAPSWNFQAAMQWLAGSLNGASWDRVLPLAAAVAVFVPVLLLFGRGLGALRLGDDAAQALGVRPFAVRVILVLAAVALIAFATSASGPVAFVAFMSGPIAARLVGPDASLTVPAGLVGAILVLGGDLAGQNLLDGRYPVGVVTGVLGAPYLMYLLVRMNRSGNSI